MRVLDLFSGIGGFSLGLERTGGFETVAFCEIEDYPRRVLRKHWPNVPIHKDVRKLKGSDVGAVDLVCGGYPCQPFSTAGQRRGAEDDRHLWPEFMRLVAELRPTWVIGENVAGHISMGLDNVLSDLEGQGYACRAFVIPACAVGAAHRRDRVWTVGHASQLQRDGGGQHSEPSEGQVSQSGKPSGAGNVADTSGQGLQRGAEAGNACSERARRNKQFAGCNNNQAGPRRFEPELGRMVDGISAGLDEPRERVTTRTPKRAQRLKALGNAVHPAIPYAIGLAILAASASADSIREWPTMQHFDGTASRSYIELGPPQKPGASATVTFQNYAHHGAGDRMSFPLTWDGITATIHFDYRGADMDTVTVDAPEGYLAHPPEIAVDERGLGHIHIYSTQTEGM